MPELLAAVLAKTLFIMLEALLMRLAREIFLISLRRYRRPSMVGFQAA